MLICKYCYRECKNNRSLAQHEIRCNKNNNKIPVSGAFKTGNPNGRFTSTIQPITPWNKGLSKETDERVKKNADSCSITLQKQVKNNTFVPRRMSNIELQKLSERMSLNNPGGKSKWYKVAGQSVQGTYERDFAFALEEQNIEWEKIKTNNHLFKYELNGKIKSYAPDFYLPEFNLYIEIKGFWWGNDKEKMEAVKRQHKDKNIVILFGRSKLDFIIEDIRKNLQLEPAWSW